MDEILTRRKNLVLVARLRHLMGAGQIADDVLARFRLTDAIGAAGLFVYAPFPGRPASVVTTEYDIPRDASAPLTLAEMGESIRRALGIDVPLTPPPGDRPHPQCRLVGTNTWLAERFRDRRVLLVGDAAHVRCAVDTAEQHLGQGEDQQGNRT